jgi:6-phospho-3-hexuloisomerase
MSLTSAYTLQILQELSRTLENIEDEAAQKLVDRMLHAKRIFVAGAGRSGLMIRAFAMRLMHAGLDVYVVGETVTPSLMHGDLLIIGSGSGETKSLAAIAEKAKKLGAYVAIVTVSPQSTIGQLADIVLHIPASPKESEAKASISVQPMGSLFEQSLLLLFDSLILQMMEQRNINASSMLGRHANLE